MPVMSYMLLDPTRWAFWAFFHFILDKAMHNFKILFINDLNVSLKDDITKTMTIAIVVSTERNNER